MSKYDGYEDRFVKRPNIKTQGRGTVQAVGAKAKANRDVKDQKDLEAELLRVYRSVKIADRPRFSSWLTVVIAGSLVVREADLKFTDDKKSHGPGGQNVNKRATAISVRHQPSGLVVEVSETRSQDQNRAIATARIWELVRNAVEVAKKVAKNKKLKEVFDGK